MSGDGWVKLHRIIEDSRVFQNAELLKVWVWCLIKANHRDMWVPFRAGGGTTEILVKSGQFIFGRKTAAKKLKMKPSSVRNRIKKLENMRNVDIQTDTHPTIVTICNWEKYQGRADEGGQASGQSKDRRRTGVGQVKDTNKKVKKVKNEKKNDENLPPPSAAGLHQACVDWFCEEYEKQMGIAYEFRGGRDGKAIKDLIEKYEPDEIKSMAKAMFEDDWWREQASPVVLWDQRNKWRLKVKGDKPQRTTAEILGIGKYAKK